MTKREAAIVTAHTGIPLGSFSDFHKYCEELFERPVWTHEMGSKEFSKILKRLSKPDFQNIKVD